MEIADRLLFWYVFECGFGQFRRAAALAACPVEKVSQALTGVYDGSS
jgi:hypothetical protein